MQYTHTHKEQRIYLDLSYLIFHHAERTTAPQPTRRGKLLHSAEGVLLIPYNFWSFTTGVTKGGEKKLTDSAI